MDQLGNSLRNSPRRPAIQGFDQANGFATVSYRERPISKELSANTTLSHYRIVSKIGAGGMGEVSWPRTLNWIAKVALKILPPELASNRDRMERFVREAKAAAAFNHHNIATIHEIVKSDEVNMIAMEFIDGADAAGKNSPGANPPTKVVLMLPLDWLCDDPRFKDLLRRVGFRNRKRASSVAKK